MASKAPTDYPQMPPLTQDEIATFLSQPLIARLGTINEDGTIHIAPVIFKYEKGEFIIGTQNANRRIRNIKRSPKVTLLIDDPTPPFKAVLVYGKAELDYDDVIQKRIAIFEKYNPKSKLSKWQKGFVPSGHRSSYASDLIEWYRLTTQKLLCHKRKRARFTKRGKRTENTFTNLYAVCTQL